MAAVTRPSANALTASGASLPDTLTVLELGAPVPKPVHDFIVKTLVAPVLLKYRGGQAQSEAEYELLFAEYAEDCIGFMPEAYRVAVKLMGRDRVERWQPTSGECREWLQKAEDEISALAGRPRQVRDQEPLKTAMYWMLHEDHEGPEPRLRQPWDRATCGPMPTEPGCRLDPSKQQHVWQLYFRAHANEPQTTTMKRLQEARLLVDLGIAIAPPTCPILRGAMVEFGIPMTPDDVARAEREQEEMRLRYEAEREVARIKYEAEIEASRQARSARLGFDPWRKGVRQEPEEAA